MEKSDHINTVGKNVNYYKLYWKQLNRVLKKFKTELLDDSAMPLLGKYPKKRKSPAHTPIVITGLTHNK